MKDEEIEALLRKVPTPRSPASLLDRLQAEVRVGGKAGEPAGWWMALKRWWPAAVGLALSLAVWAGQLRMAGSLRREKEARAENRLAGLEDAAGKESARCFNNISNIILGARVFASDHGGWMPTNFLMMSNELATPKILVCPGDGKRMPADFEHWTWKNYREGDSSYQILAPGAVAARPLEMARDPEATRNLERDRVRAEVDYQRVKQLLENLKSKNPEELRPGLLSSFHDESLERFLGEMTKIEQQLSVMVKDYPQTHPEVIRLTTLYTNINQQVETQIDLIMSGLEMTVNSRKSVLEDLQISIERGKIKAAPAIVYLRCPVHGHVALVDGRPMKLEGGRALVQKNGQWIFVEAGFE